jgi:hypothetical protein
VTGIPANVNPLTRLEIMRLRFLMPAALLIAAAGCDSTLTTQPADRVPAEQVIVDASSARAALVGAYDALQSLDYYGLGIEMLGDLSAAISCRPTTPPSPTPGSLSMTRSRG